MANGDKKPLPRSRSYGGSAHIGHSTDRNTRGATGSLPAGSRNEQIWNNLSSGRAANAPPAPGPKDVPPPIQSNQEIRPEPLRASSSTARAAPDQLEFVQGVCAAENEPTRQEIKELRELVANLELQRQPNAVTREEVNDLLADNREQLQKMMRAERDNNPLAGDVAQLRRDYNALLEDRSVAKSSPTASRAPQDAPSPPRKEGGFRTDKEELAAIRERLYQLGVQNDPHFPRRMPEPAVLNPIRLGYNERAPSPLNPRPSESPFAKVPEQSQPLAKGRDPTPLYVDSDEDSDDADIRAVYQQRQPVADTGIDAMIPFFKRPKGEKHPGLTVIRPSEPAFDRLLNYRFYRLFKTGSVRDANDTLDARYRAKALEVTMKEHRFSGQDPILVLSFLTRYVEECDQNRLIEAQAYLLLPQYLTKEAATNYRATRYGSRSGGVTCWPEAIQHLLTMYATSAAIREALHDIRNMRQMQNETETAFSCRVNHAAYRCGNVFAEHEKISIFVNGLIPEIWSVIARARDDTPRPMLNYLMLVQRAQDEGDVYRARFSGNKTAMPSSKAAPSRRNPHATVAFLDQLGHESDRDDLPDQLMYMGQETSQPPTSVPTDDLPSTTDLHAVENEKESLLYAGNPRPKARELYPTQHHGINRQQETRARLICHSCFEYDHISPDCKSSLADLQKVVCNYEALSSEEKKRVPRLAYDMAKRFLGDEEKEAHASDHVGSKNV